MSERPAGELEFRTAKQLGVSFPERTIELVVMPYEEETLIEDPRHPGRMAFEVCSRGAFDGIERRANRVRVNRDHDAKRTVGRAIAFHPSREEGLVAEIRIARTELGDETLTLADEEILDASAGFLPMPGGELWETRNRRRLNKAWLGHIALTPDPAYESSRVLAVRQAAAVAGAIAAERIETPNLDTLRALMLDERYSLLDKGH
jgi:HK97 family phage prohead protease